MKEFERTDDEIDILYIDDEKFESNRSLERTRRSLLTDSQEKKQ